MASDICQGARDRRSTRGALARDAARRRSPRRPPSCCATRSLASRRCSARSSKSSPPSSADRTPHDRGVAQSRGARPPDRHAGSRRSLETGHRARAGRESQHGPSRARGARRSGATAEHVALRPRPRARREPRSSIGCKPRIAELMAQFPTSPRSACSRSCAPKASTAATPRSRSRVRAVRPKPQPQPSLTTPDYGPGEMAESDWSPYEITFTDGQAPHRSGALVRAGPQQAEVLRALREQRPPRADGRARARVRALRGLRTSVQVRQPEARRAALGSAISPSTIRASSRSRATTSFDLSRCAAVTPTTSRVPRDRSGKSSARSSTAAPSATSTTCARSSPHWLDDIVDHRRRHKRTALERFADEREHLVALPRHPYDTARVVYRVCGIDGFVAWDGNRYAVPYDHVTDILPVRITQQRALRLRRRPALRRAPRARAARRGPEARPRRIPPARSTQEPYRSRSAPRRLRATWASAPPTSFV